MVKHVNSKEFNEAIVSGTVVVDFSATWCGPCKMLAPVYEEAARDLEGKATFLKVDIDESSELAQEYGIVSVPSIVLLKDGVKKDMTMGFQPKENLISFVEKHL